MTAIPAPLTRTPFVGLTALAAALFMLAIGHTTLVLMRHLLNAEVDITGPEVALSLAMGAAGMAMVWHGRLRGEAIGTWFGFIAGTLIWVGFFELGWKTFSHALKVQPVEYQGIPVLSAELQVIQASVIPFLMLMVFLTINKETRCNMMLWVRRQLRLDAGRAMTGKERNFAAITAMESIAVTWACYIITIMIVDPRIVGNPMTTSAQLPYLGFFAWGMYLIWRLAKQKHMAPALRYAIGTAGINWIWIEAGSRAEMYPEIWIKPVEYPVLMTLVFAVLVGTLVLMRLNSASRGAEPALAE
ncbi:MAG: hypothetical protein SFV21_06255 [Rhodospirillaceae bacterium]|nr:hypothetical protein [Rhodospirillaceae bacterium]